MTTGTKSAIETVENYVYRYTNCFHESMRRRILFTERGKARLASIMGYIVGLKHAGQTEFAEKMATEFLEVWGQVVSDQHSAVTMDDGTIFDVPDRKCIISDDGCLHSFSLLWLVPVSPQKWSETLWAKKVLYKQSYPEATEYQRYVWAKAAAIEELQIVEFSTHSTSYFDQLTEERYSHKVYYRPQYNGGLIYHGPGAGETFTVNLGSSNRLWGVHT